MAMSTMPSYQASEPLIGMTSPYAEERGAEDREPGDESLKAWIELGAHEAQRHPGHAGAERDVERKESSCDHRGTSGCIVVTLTVRLEPRGHARFVRAANVGAAVCHERALVTGRGSWKEPCYSAMTDGRHDADRCRKRLSHRAARAAGRPHRVSSRLVP
jgi:hypothetical protein